MATLLTFPSMHSMCFPHRMTCSSLSLAFGNVRLHSLVLPISNLKLVAMKEPRSSNHRLRVVKVVEEETPVPEQQEEASMSKQQTILVPILPSDTLTMFFQAKGTMNEMAIPAVTKALEETEGVTSLKVHIVKGIASVELKKQTIVQATGVASALVETIQSSGFKLQTLYLSFNGEDATA